MCKIEWCADKTDSVLCRKHLYAFNKYNLLHPDARISAEEFIRINGKYRTGKYGKRKRETCAVFGCINGTSNGTMCEGHLEELSKFEKKFPGVQVDVQGYIRTGALREKK